MRAPSRTGAPRPYPRDIPGLTSLRFVAAIWIVLLHYVWWLAPAGGPLPVVPVVAQGGNAVDFFFVLSGFILTHAHHAQIRTGTLDLRDFAVRRFARIYPLHVATLGFYLVLVLSLGAVGLKLTNPDRYAAGTFFINLAMLQAFQTTDAGSWNFPSWSVSAEWLAYLLFPLLAGGMLRRLARVPALALLLLAYGVFLLLCALAGPLLGRPYFELHAYGGWYRIMPEFVLGIALYRVGTEYEIGRLGSRPALFALGAGVLAAAALRAEVATVTLLALVILGTAEASRRAGGGILNSRLFTYLGTVSFALYMVHLPVATLVFGAASFAFGKVSVGIVAGAVAVAVAVAAVTHHLVEMPAYRFLIRRLAGRRPARNPTLEGGVGSLG